MSKQQIINSWKPFLWSYDINKIDLSKDKKRIITNVLNFGTHKATKLLFEVYSVKEIGAVVQEPLPGEWNKKSLNFWSLMLKIKPVIKSRMTKDRISKK